MPREVVVPRRRQHGEQHEQRTEEYAGGDVEHAVEPEAEPEEHTQQRAASARQRNTLAQRLNEAKGHEEHERHPDDQVRLRQVDVGGVEDRNDVDAPADVVRPDSQVSAVLLEPVRRLQRFADTAELLEVADEGEGAVREQEHHGNQAGPDAKVT